jgi:hypothetical protein
MAEFNVQSDSVDVTRIMEQIRQRIHEKRGRDYTEEQIRELAHVKLERFLDPQQVRSDLVEHYRQLNQPEALETILQGKPLAVPALFDFDEHTIYASSRGTMGKLIRLIRKLLNPILKLFLNPNPLVLALTRQAEINAWTLQILQQEGKKFAARAELEALNYEVLNNLVVEMTRLAVDMKNHRMLVESVAGRLDFDERRARALESVVQKGTQHPPDGAGDGGEEIASASGSGRTRRRRRRSRRRPGATATPDTGTNSPAPAEAVARDEAAEPTPGPATSTLPADAAARQTVPAASHVAMRPPAPGAEPSEAPPETTPPPAAAAPLPDPGRPTSSVVPQVADAESPAATPTPSIPGPSAATVPATAPATETVAPTSPTGEAGTDK